MNPRFQSLLKQAFDYAPDEFVPYREMFDKFPVYDVQAVHEKSINPEIFIPYLEKIVAQKRKENLVQDYLNEVLEIFNNLSEGTRVTKACRGMVAYNLWHVNDLKRDNRHKRRYQYSPGGATIVVEEEFFNVNELLWLDIDNKLLIAAIGEVQQEVANSKHRLDNVRRRELRNAISENYDWLYTKWLDIHFEVFKPHQTKIDRIVIEIYTHSLETWQGNIKALIKKNTKGISKDLAKKRIITDHFIDSMEGAEFADSQTIDELIAEFKDIQKQQKSEGYVAGGTIVVEEDIGKLMFTFSPQNRGAPVRLRLISNVQNLIKKQLWSEQPEKEAIYKAHVWSKGTEHNFIMPEDYDYYLQHEASTCNILETQAKALYYDFVKKYVGFEISLKRLVVHVSQCEVCYEEPFVPQELKRILPDDTDNPHLWDYMLDRQIAFHKFVHTHVNDKFEAETSRPSILCDFPTMNPELPLMQYKIYPKFRNTEGQAMIRTEMIPNQFTKFAHGDATDEIPLSLKALSNPEYYRKTIESFLQFELYHNGIEGNGYNLRNKPITKTKQEKQQQKILGLAIFKSQKQLDKYYPLFISFVDTGMLPSGFPPNYKTRMLEIGLIRKKKHGMYQR